VVGESPILICAFRHLTAGIERELLVIHAFPVSEVWESINRPSTCVDRLTLRRASSFCLSSSFICTKELAGLQATIPFIPSEREKGIMT